MASKEFHFDFNEDAEPVEELHRLRAAMTRHFKTNKEHWDYFQATPTVEEVLAELRAELAAKDEGAGKRQRRNTRKRGTLAAVSRTL